MKTAVIFDLGKTLIEVPSSIDEEDNLAARVGMAPRDMESIIIDVCAETLSMEPDRFIARVVERLQSMAKYISVDAFADICRRSIDECILHSDVIPCLETLRRRGASLGVLSNTNPISHLRLRHTGIVKYFDAVMFSCDIGLMKPDPRAFQLILRQLAYDADNVWIVGDRIRTLTLGTQGLLARRALIERRLAVTVETNRMPVDAILPTLDGLPAVVFRDQTKI